MPAGRGILVTTAALMAAALLVGCGRSGTEPAVGLQATAVTASPTPVPTPIATAQPEVVPTPVDRSPGLVAEFVEVSLKGGSLEVSESMVVAEEVYFNVSNAGDEPHELIVVRTDLDGGSLPVGSTGQAVLSEVAGRTKVLADGNLEVFEIEPIAPGKYVLLCNLPGHYQGGEYTGFEVLAPR